MCAYFITPDLIRKNNLTGQGNYSQANYSFITTVHLIDLIRLWKKKQKTVDSLQYILLVSNKSYNNII